MLVSPIGYIQSDNKYRYETPRQGVLAGNNISIINLNTKNNFQQALTGLDGFDRIWVIYLFHLNPNWKPMVTPPRHTRKKVGVFATRSPHRPNQIGLSCVKLEKVEGLNLYISESDILDGSPVLDIKPYLPYSDSFPNVKTGWVKSGLEEKYDVEFMDLALSQMNWLMENANINLNSFAKLQLEFNPTDTSRKRISKTETEGSIQYTLAYRTWRINFYSFPDNMHVVINSVSSGYTNDELLDTKNDKYEDKKLHILFISVFSH